MRASSTRRVAHAWLIGAMVTAIAIPASGTDQTGDGLSRTVGFSIREQPLSTALLRFSEQAAVPVTTDSSIVAFHRSPALRGKFAVRDAVARLLEGSELTFVEIGGGGIAILRASYSAVGTAQRGHPLTMLASTNGIGFAAAAPSATSRVQGSVGSQSSPTTAASANPLVSGATSQDSELEEIIVSANRRDERILDVPISMTVLGGNQLRELGISDVTSLAGQIPNFTMGSPAGDGTTPSLSIRGIGLNTFSDNLEGAVAVYVDEVYLATVAGQGAKLFDLKRVEVLRGPQGTLYGRNATAGLVHFVTNTPTDVAEGYGELTLGSFSQRRFEGALSGPLGENVRGRISVLFDRDDGYMRERVSGERVASKDVIAGRAQLAADVGESTSLHLRVHGSRVRNLSVLENHRGLLDPVSFTPCSVARVNARECVDAFGYRDPNSDPYAANFHGADDIPLNLDTVGGSLTASGRIGEWNLVSITSYEELKKRHVEAGVVVPFGLATAAGLAAFENAKFTLDLDSRQVTQELRASRQFEDLFVMFGGFYMDDKKEGSVELPSSYQNPLAPSQDPYLNRFAQNLDTWAAFAYAQWDPNEVWDIRVGLRFSSEGSDSAVNVNTGGFFGAVLGAPDVLEARRFDDEFVSWDFTANWKPTEDFLLYGKVANGYKSGGTNAGGIISSVPQIEPFASENLKMYEIGIKSAWASQRVRTSAAAFFYDYKDLQLFTQSFISGIPVDRIENAANADIRGIELEVTGKVSTFLDLQLGAAYLDTGTKDFVGVIGTTPGGASIFEDRSGKRLVFAPEFSFNGSVRAQTRMFGGDASATLAFNYVSEYFFDIGNSPLDAAGDLTLWNARVAWASSGGRWDVAASVQNLTNEEYYTEGYNLFGAQYRFVGRPRTWGVSYRIRL